MDSIFNMFYNLDGSNTKPNNNNNKKHFNNNLISTPALNHGANFTNYQNKIKNYTKKTINNVNSREGFQTNSNTSSTNTSSTNTSSNSNTSSSTDTSSSQLASQAKQVLSDTSSGTDNTLQNEYKLTLLAYQKLLKKVSNNTTDYIDRVNGSKNKYLNKLVRWTDPNAKGAVMYVTNQGVAKPINDPRVLKSILGVNGCPNIKSMTSISLTWDSSYMVEGTIIPTKPTLVVGPLMTTGESCGNEGNNVYVNTLITDTSATYDGCYGDDATDPVMTFIGGAPASMTGILNGNFDQPVLKNNTYSGITSQSQVPNWNFAAVLLNNSSAWGYPTPYPNGNQCCSLQKTDYIEQTLNLDEGSYTISFMACGRSSQKGPNQINVKLNGTTIYSITPPKNVWTSYSTSLTITTTGNNVINFSGVETKDDKSSAIQNVSLDSSGVSTTLGTYTYDMCKNAAIDGGYKYFALQNVNTDTSMGYCAASNDYVNSTKNGTAYVVTSTISLWDSKSTGSGNTASLTDQGTLTVYNSSGAAIYNTPSDTSLSSGGYIGCYKDKTDSRAMMNTSSGKYYSFDTCKQYGTDGNYSYYSSQNKDKNNNGWCAASNDLKNAQKYGVANNCTTDASGNYMGGSKSNAIYSMDQTGTYYLILQDDGNMVIYKGTSPDDNQGQIWSSDTSGQQQQPNSTYTSDKGKYGENWIASTSTLASGDFVGSTDGSIYLIMQSDGNLVLYTSTRSENCSRMSNGNTGGGSYANALYELSSVGVPDNLGKVAYIDSNSNLYPYPDSSLGLSNDYNVYSDYDSAGNDLSGTSFADASIDSCKTACNNNNDCYGFVFDTTTNTCNPKGKGMYPAGEKQPYSGYDLYTRTPKITSPPTGVSNKITNIDSVLYQNYTKSNSDLGTSYGLSVENANSVEQQQLDQLKTRLDQISQQLIDNTNSLSSDGVKVVNQSTLQTNSIGGYLKDYKNINTKIRDYTSGMDNILHESDITILKENYNYLFWSILTIGTVLVTMNIVKN
jgi:hypothetical protein